MRSEQAMMAATARRYERIVVTCNIADFAHFGVKLFHPFRPDPG